MRPSRKTRAQKNTVPKLLQITPVWGKSQTRVRVYVCLCVCVCVSVCVRARPLVYACGKCKRVRVRVCVRSIRITFLLSLYEGCTKAV